MSFPRIAATDPGRVKRCFLFTLCPVCHTGYNKGMRSSVNPPCDRVVGNKAGIRKNGDADAWRLWYTDCHVLVVKKRDRTQGNHFSTVWKRTLCCKKYMGSQERLKFWRIPTDKERVRKRQTVRKSRTQSHWPNSIAMKWSQGCLTHTKRLRFTQPVLFPASGAFRRFPAPISLASGNSVLSDNDPAV